MKNIFTTLIVTFAVLFSITSSAQITISPYYGGPNTTSVGLLADDNYLFEVYNTPMEIDFSNIGPLGLVASYAFENKIAVGLDINYTTCKTSFSYFESYNDSISGDSYNMEAERAVIRAMMRFDAHFGDNERFDPYLSLGLGYRTTSTSYISDRPGFVETPRETLIPVAFRLAAGLNVWIIDELGIMLETGLGGGGLGRFGVTYRIQ